MSLNNIPAGTSSPYWVMAKNNLSIRHHLDYEGWLHWSSIPLYLWPSSYTLIGQWGSTVRPRLDVIFSCVYFSTPCSPPFYFPFQYGFIRVLCLLMFSNILPVYFYFICEKLFSFTTFSWPLCSIVLVTVILNLFFYISISRWTQLYFLFGKGCPKLKYFSRSIKSREFTQLKFWIIGVEVRRPRSRLER